MAAQAATTWASLSITVCLLALSTYLSWDVVAQYTNNGAAYGLAQATNAIQASRAQLAALYGNAGVLPESLLAAAPLAFPRTAYNLAGRSLSGISRAELASSGEGPGVLLTAPSHTGDVALSFTGTRGVISGASRVETNTVSTDHLQSSDSAAIGVFVPMSLETTRLEATQNVTVAFSTPVSTRLRPDGSVNYIGHVQLRGTTTWQGEGGSGWLGSAQQNVTIPPLASSVGLMSAMETITLIPPHTANASSLAIWCSDTHLPSGVTYGPPFCWGYIAGVANSIPFVRSYVDAQSFVRFCMSVTHGTTSVTCAVPRSV